MRKKTAGERPLGELIEAGTAYLDRHGVPCPRVVCELLAGRLLGCPRLDLQLRLQRLRIHARHLRGLALRRNVTIPAAIHRREVVVHDWFLARCRRILTHCP